jgi:hypothetical protein
MVGFALASLVAMGIFTVAMVTTRHGLACMGARHPSGRLIAIDEALPTARIAPTKLTEVRELRQKAYGLTAAGRLTEAHDVADRALQILGVEWKPELGGPPTRC